MSRPVRLRRSCLAVPGSNPHMLGKAATLAADEIILDLEDAVAAAEKTAARANVIAALTGTDWGGRIRAVRVNDWTSEWTVQDIVEIVTAAGASLDCLVLPKVNTPSQIHAVDLILSQLERAQRLPEGRIGLEVQIEDALGLDAAAGLAAVPRVETLVFGPVDFSADIGVRELPDPAHESVLLHIVVAARAHGKQAIDGPFLAFRDPEGFSRSAARSAQLGYAGKWVIHPAQIDAANTAYSPGQQEFDRAEALLEAYERHLAAGRGAAVFEGEMIDEASRKLALAVVARGRAAGRSGTGSPHQA